MKVTDYTLVFVQRRGIMCVCKLAHGQAARARVPVSSVVLFSCFMQHGLILLVSETKEAWDDEKEDPDSTLLTSYFEFPYVC